MNKIFIGPVEIAGFQNALAKGFQSRGWDVYIIDVWANKFKYKRVPGGRAISFFQKCFDLLGPLRKIKGSRIFLWPIVTFLKFWVFVLILPRCQNYIFIFGQSLLPFNLDLWILKKIGCRVLHVYLGSDSRPAYFSGAWLNLSESKSAKQKTKLAAKYTKSQSRKLNRIYRWSSAVIDNPMSGALQPGRYINWFQMGFPSEVDMEEAISKDPWEKTEGPFVIHAPSNSTIKGSDLIEQVLDELREEGVAFKFKKLIDVPNCQVKELLSKCHVVIDELYSDCPLAGLGAESAARGCAVVVGGYGWQELRQMAPEEMIAQSILVNTETLKKKLRQLLTDETYCREVGASLRSFILEKWNVHIVAERYVQVLSGNEPRTWWVHPESMTYTGGMGAPPEKFGDLIREMINLFGVDALSLQSNPKLRERILHHYHDR